MSRQAFNLASGQFKLPVEQGHGLAAQRMDDVPVIDDVAPGQQTVAGPQLWLAERLATRL
jgi:hypothetical protein